jgi:hypothetical protein
VRPSTLAAGRASICSNSHSGQYPRLSAADILSPPPDDVGMNSGGLCAIHGFEPQGGDLTKPRATPWVNGTRINPEP